MLLRNSLPDTPSPVARPRRSTESVLSAADTSLGQSENPSDSESCGVVALEGVHF